MEANFSVGGNPKRAWTLGQLFSFPRLSLSGFTLHHIFLYLFTQLFGVYFLISAFVATQLSALWDYFVGEHRGDNGSNRLEPIAGQIGAYLFTNNVLFALRAPLLYWLVTSFEWHYLIGGIVSFAAAALLRTLFTETVLPDQQRAFSRRRPFCYNIHGIVRVESDVRLPELAKFKVPASNGPIDIHVKIEPAKDGTDSVQVISYSELIGKLGFQMHARLGDRAQVSASVLVGRSPHVLYTNIVEPLLRWCFVRKGYALVHGACLAGPDGKALLMTALTDTGKTTTILNTLARHNQLTFMSDDMTILGKDGDVFSFPKPLTISMHTLKTISTATLNWKQRLALQLQSRLHSREGRWFGLLLTRLGLPAASLNSVVQILIPPPKYTIQELIPTVKTVNEAKLSHLVIIERGHDREEPIEAKAAVDQFLSNCEDAYGFPPYPVIAKDLSQWGGRDLHAQERAVVEQALEHIPRIRLGSTEYKWWQRIPHFVNAQ